MNNEYITLIQSLIAGLSLLIASAMYSWGGRSGKWRRRFIASSILALALNLMCLWRGIWSAYLLITYPLLIAGFSLGYGGETLGYKILRRSLYCSAIIVSGLLCVFILRGNAIWVFIPHLGVAAFSIYMGVRNPIEAAAEEFFICIMLNLGLMMYPFIGVQ